MITEQRPPQRVLLERGTLRGERTSCLVGHMYGQLGDGIVQPLSSAGVDDISERGGILLQECLHGSE